MGWYIWLGDILSFQWSKCCSWIKSGNLEISHKSKYVYNIHVLQVSERIEWNDTHIHLARDIADMKNGNSHAHPRTARKTASGSVNFKLRDTTCSRLCYNATSRAHRYRTAGVLRKTVHWWIWSKCCTEAISSPKMFWACWFFERKNHSNSNVLVNVIVFIWRTKIRNEGWSEIL